MNATNIRTKKGQAKAATTAKRAPAPATPEQDEHEPEMGQAADALAVTVRELYALTGGAVEPKSPGQAMATVPTMIVDAMIKMIEAKAWPALVQHACAMGRSSAEPTVSTTADAGPPAEQHIKNALEQLDFAVGHAAQLCLVGHLAEVPEASAQACRMLACVRGAHEQLDHALAVLDGIEVSS